MQILPVVSVLVTVYNREKYLAETISSILRSTYQKYEVIVVDDNSSDDSLAIARSMAELDQRVRVYANEENLGDYGNRMKAASLARGRYIKYVDSDDLIYPHSLAIMVESMEQYPDAALALAHSMPEDESPYPWRLSPEEVYKKHFLGRGCLSCGPTGAIIRREAFEAIGGFDKTWGVLADIDLWLRLSASWPVVLLPPGLVWWRRHEEQEFTKDDAHAVYLQRGYELNKNVLGSEECPLSVHERATALERIHQHFARRLLSFALKNRRVRSAIRIYNSADLSVMALIKGFGRYK